MFENFWEDRGDSFYLQASAEETLPAEYRQPSIDVVETDREVIARAEMPGLDKENIKINLTEDRLEISAETKKEEEKKEKGYVYRKCAAGVIIARSLSHRR